MGGLLSGRFGETWPDEVTAIGFCGAVIGDWEWAREVISLPELPHIEFDPLAISRDPAAGESYANDPLVYHGQYKRGLLENEVVALDAFAEHIDRLTMPVALFHGTGDPFVPWERSKKAIEDMPSSDKEIHIYEDARHEVLNEINKDQIIGDLVAWVDRIA
jgi:alpha-beta hydrolase superfamily lysophospholipase